jgi:hypothetical protein
MRYWSVIAILLIVLSSCGGSTNVSKPVPGAGGTQIYELMEEEDSSAQKADTASKSR